MWQAWAPEAAPNSSGSSSTASHTKWQTWDPEAAQTCTKGVWASGRPPAQWDGSMEGYMVPVPEDMDTTLDPKNAAATPDAENPKNAAATRRQRTIGQYHEHIKQFNKDNVRGEKMDVMYKKWSHDAWDQWLFRMDDRGLEKSWNWNRLKWYEWYLAARARAQKQAEEDAKTQRLLERQMYGREEGDSDVDPPFPGEKRRRHT
jgi:hypothetical protein